MSTIFKNPPFQARLIQPKSFEDCLTYGEQIYCLYKMILELDEKLSNIESKENFIYTNGSGNEIGNDSPGSERPDEPDSETYSETPSETPSERPDEEEEEED